MPKGIANILMNIATVLACVFAGISCMVSFHLFGRDMGEFVKFDDFRDPIFRCHLRKLKADLSRSPLRRISSGFTEKELEKIRDLNLAGSGARSFDSLSSFYNLRTLKCSRSLVGEIDLSLCKQIEHVDCAYCRELTSLRINQCTNTSKVDRTVDISGAKILETLSIYGSGVVSLTGIEGREHLKRVWCWDTRLCLEGSNDGILDVSTLCSLEELYCWRSKIRKIKFAKSGNEELHSLFCDENSLHSLRVDRLPKLRQIRCHDNKIKTLDFSKCPLLEEIDCRQNKIKKLDLRACKMLRYVACDRNVKVKYDKKRLQRTIQVVDNEKAVMTFKRLR